MRTYVAGAVLVAASVTGVALGAAARADVVPVCGDANGDGDITVSDGVAVLRAAADLSSPCTIPICDVNDDGAVTVADAVNVLRNAAGLSAIVACAGGTPTPAPTATPGGNVDADVQRIASDILPFLASMSPLTGGSVSAVTLPRSPVEAERFDAQPEALKNDACPDGGSRVDDEGSPTRTLTFSACRISNQLGSFQFDGTVVITLSNFNGGSIAFDFTLTDLAASHAVEFMGTLQLAVAQNGLVLNGPLAVATPEGNFTLQSNNVTITANRKLVSGSGTVTDDANAFDIATVAFMVTNGGASSKLTATFDDSSVHTYTLDLQTGALTQTS